MRCIRHSVKTKQMGAAAVEFAIVAILFFTLLFGVIELGRLLYVWNTVQEVTRRAAREAVVTDFTDETKLTALKHNAVFGGSALPAAPEVGYASVQIAYLNLSRGVIADKDLPDDPTANAQACVDQDPVSCIAFVQASLQATYVPMVGLFSYFGMNVPPSTVTMPAESMGYVPPSPP